MNNHFIKESFFYTHAGKKEVNEDFIIHGKKHTTHTDYFILCDGVSGSPCGETASKSVAYFFADHFDNNGFTGNEQYFTDALKYTEKRLSAEISSNPACAEMAATCVLIYITGESLWVGNCGDSPAFQFRKGEIIFRTADHNYINFLKVSNLLPPGGETEVLNPKELVRAIKGAAFPTALDVYNIKEIEDDDCFLLCSDGVLEAFTTAELQILFKKELPLETTAKLLYENCLLLSKDNFSFHLLQLRA